MERHPGSLRLLNLSRGFAATDDERAHVEACDACRARLTGLQAEADAMLSLRNPEAVVVDLAGEGRRRSRAWFLVPALAGAAAVVLVGLLVRVPDEDRATDGVRWKGSFGVALRLERDGRAFEPPSDQRFQAGDRIYLDVAASEPGRVSVSAEDGGRFVPVPELQSVPVPAGARVGLPGKLLLDCRSGTERVRVTFVRQDAPADAPFEQVLSLRCAP